MGKSISFPTAEGQARLLSPWLAAWRDVSQEQRDRAGTVGAVSGSQGQPSGGLRTDWAPKSVREGFKRI